jgi:hypothetical protein
MQESSLFARGPWKRTVAQGPEGGNIHGGYNPAVSVQDTVDSGLVGGRWGFAVRPRGYVFGPESSMSLDKLQEAIDGGVFAGFGITPGMKATRDDLEDSRYLEADNGRSVYEVLVFPFKPGQSTGDGDQGELAELRQRLQSTTEALATANQRIAELSGQGTKRMSDLLALIGVPQPAGGGKIARAWKEERAAIRKILGA